VNDPDRVVAWSASTWAAGMDGELPAPLWAADGLTVGEDPAGPDPTGGLVSLAFLREALSRKAWLWCLTAALGLLIGSGLYVRYPPAEHAQTSVLLVDSANEDPSVEIQTDQTLAESQPVAARVVQELGLRQSIASFQSAYSVTPMTDTVLQFEVGAPSSAAAVQQASALASAFLQYRAKYAQIQEQQQAAQLTQQFNAAQQSLQALDAQIGQLSSTQLTPAQKIQLDNLQTREGDQKEVMQYVTATEATTKTSTDAMVSGSVVLNPATPLEHSRLKGAVLYVAGGLFAGLVVGMAIVVIAALLSDRLRRRDDVAAMLGAPVRLSVGSLRAPGWRPARPGQRAKRARDRQRLITYLQGAVPGSSGGPASLAIVAVDDVQTVASAVESLARSATRAGRQVLVADLSRGIHLARLLGVKDPGLHEVSSDGGRLLVAVPERDDVTPVGPVRSGSSPAIWAQPDGAVVNACSSADLLLALVTLDPALGGDHLATWASDAVVVVTVGHSSGEKVHSVGEMIRLSGTRLDSAILIGADRNDESLGIFDGAAGQPGDRKQGDGVPAGGFKRGE
jgi:capsular polysaccharide biosynthesis protein